MLRGQSTTDSLRERLAWFTRSPGLRGLSGEVMLRKALFGPLEAFSRVLAVRGWSAGSTAGISPGYNDFFRGIQRDRPLDSYVIFNNDLLLVPRAYSVSVWETLLLKSFELSAFCDLLWQDPALSSAAANPALGLSLQAEAGFMGLVSLTMMASGGYDLEAEEAFFFLNLGALY